MRLTIVLVGGFLLASGLAFSPLTAQLPAQVGGVRDTQPSAKAGGIRLSGRVLAGDTGRPIRNAIVVAVAMSAGGRQNSTSTGADGRWEIGDLTAASYTISVAKAGYVTMKYGQRRPDQTAKVLDLKDGQVVDKIDLSLPRGAVIAGRISDEFGEPVSGAIVSAMRYSYVEGQRPWLPVGGTGFDTLLTGGLVDDQGQFRIYGLPAGDYLVSATLGDGAYVGQGNARTSYAPTFYPGTASATDAQRVTVDAGQEAQNITFSLARINVATISGKAIDSFGNPIARSGISLRPAPGTSTSTSGWFLNYAGQLATRPDGTFTIPNVPPGEYVLHAQTSTGGGGRGLGSGVGAAPPGRGGGLLEPELGWLAVTVAGQDVTNLTLVTARGVTAAGRVLLEGGGVPQVNGLSVRALAAAPGAVSLAPPNGNARVLPDGTFELRGVLDRQLLRVRTQPGTFLTEWFLKSVTVAGKNVTDSGYEFVAGQNVARVEIVLTQRAGTLSGTVQDERSGPVIDYAVVAFSTDPGKWRYESRFVRSVMSDQDGKFILKGLPSDDYFVVALPYLEPGEETDPVQLEKWKLRAIRITVSDADTKSLVLKLSR